MAHVCRVGVLAHVAVDSAVQTAAMHPWDLKEYQQPQEQGEEEEQEDDNEE